MTMEKKKVKSPAERLYDAQAEGAIAWRRLNAICTEIDMSGRNEALYVSLTLSVLPGLRMIRDEFLNFLQFSEDNGITDTYAALKAYICYQPTEARDAEIEAQADKWAQSTNVNSPIDAENMAAAFAAGAHWADKQPTFNPFTTDYESR